MRTFRIRCEARQAVCIVAALILGFALTSCSGSGGVQLSTDRSSYKKGQAVTVTLRNGTSDRLEYNLCPTTVEQKSAGWAPVQETHVCTLHLISMPPGGKDSTTRELPSDLERGTYRLSLSVNPGDNEQQVISNEFRVG